MTEHTSGKELSCSAVIINKSQLIFGIRKSYSQENLNMRKSVPTIIFTVVKTTIILNLKKM